MYQLVLGDPPAHSWPVLQNIQYVACALSHSRPHLDEARLQKCNDTYRWIPGEIPHRSLPRHACAFQFSHACAAC